MSDLQDFCRTVLKILETGDRPYWFLTTHGLCSNAVGFDWEYKKQAGSALKRAINDSPFPFNWDDSMDYYEECTSGNTYNNKKRLAFLHEHANL